MDGGRGRTCCLPRVAPGRHRVALSHGGEPRSRGLARAVRVWCDVLWPGRARADLRTRARMSGGARASPRSRTRPPAGRPEWPSGLRRGSDRARLAVAADRPARAWPRQPARRRAQPQGGRSPAGFGVPNLRRNVCPHFYMTGSRGAIPIQAPHLLKALIRQDNMTSRCQLRGGVHMEQGYVNDVCLTPALQPVHLLRGRADPRVTAPP